MRVTEYKDGQKETEFLAYMAFDKTVLAQVASAWRPGGLFFSEAVNIIAKLCVEYYQKYTKAPKTNLGALVVNWAEGKDDESSLPIDKVASVAIEIGKALESKNSGYIADQISSHANRVLAESLAQKILQATETNQMDRVDSLFADYKRIEIGNQALIDVLQDDAIWSLAFRERADSIIQFPDVKALEQFFGDSLARGNFVSFLAPEKRGKTFFLLELAWRAVLQRRNVLFLAAGDMSMGQMLNRLASRILKQPTKARSWPATISYPKEIHPDVVSRKFSLVAEQREYSSKPTEDDIAKARKRMIEKHIKSNNSNFKMQAFPTGTLSARRVRSIVENLAVRGWPVDLLVIDYADILEMPYARMDGREKINQLWMDLRALSLSMNCLLLTATQANKLSQSVWVIKMEHASEDKRKAAHATTIYGINQGVEEKRQGVFRLNVAADRDGEFDVERCVWVGGCLSLAQPIVVASWPEYAKPKKEKKDE